MEDKEGTFKLFKKDKAKKEEKPKKPGKLAMKINRLEQEVVVLKEQIRIVKSRLGLWPGVRFLMRLDQTLWIR